jgi:hypothetical protein
MQLLILPKAKQGVKNPDTGTSAACNFQLYITVSSFNAVETPPTSEAEALWCLSSAFSEGGENEKLSVPSG